MVLKVNPFVHNIIETAITTKDVCIDATCGNGHDTLFLCNNSKFVYSFDVQQSAIEKTTTLLKDNNLDNFKCIHESHESIHKYVTEKIKVAMFNLGYLPGSDKTIKTNETSTIKAITDILPLLQKGGLITIILYIGHEGGKQEALRVESFVTSLDRRKYKVIKYDFINQVQSPYVLIIEKQ